MTVREAARRLEVTPALVYKLCRQGKLPHRRLGFGRGVIRITEADVAAYLEACRVEVRETEKGGGKAERPRVKRGWEPPYKIF
jgi:excisionase family DNA binding protein